MPSRHTAANAKNYLDSFPPDEPVFVLRAQDRLAAETVRFWANKAQVKRCPLEKTGDAHECANEMDAWPVKKYPD